MQTLIWIGTAITVLGLAGIILSIVRIAKLRRADLPDEELRGKLNSVLPLNLGSFFLSFLGLMTIGIGVMLG